MLPSVTMFAALLLTGCDRGEPGSSGPGSEGRGRYSGIGIYEAGRMWSQVKVDSAAPPAGRAGLADDEHVIVVVDNRTGEVRQCGDHSGLCVAMNPWTSDKPTALPAPLNKTAADLDAETEDPAATMTDNKTVPPNDSR